MLWRAARPQEETLGLSEFRRGAAPRGGAARASAPICATRAGSCRSSRASLSTIPSRTPGPAERVPAAPRVEDGEPGEKRARRVGEFLGCRLQEARGFVAAARPSAPRCAPPSRRAPRRAARACPAARPPARAPCWWPSATTRACTTRRGRRRAARTTATARCALRAYRRGRGTGPHTAACAPRAAAHGDVPPLAQATHAHPPRPGAGARRHQRAADERRVRGVDAASSATRQKRHARGSERGDEPRPGGLESLESNVFGFTRSVFS